MDIGQAFPVAWNFYEGFNGRAGAVFPFPFREQACRTPDDAGTNRCSLRSAINQLPKHRT